MDGGGVLRYSYLDGACVFGAERGRWRHIETMWAARTGVPDGMGDLSDHAVCCFVRHEVRLHGRKGGRPYAVPIKLRPTTHAQRVALRRLEERVHAASFVEAVEAGLMEAVESKGSAVEALAKALRAAGEEAVDSDGAVGRQSSAACVRGSAAKLLEAALVVRRDGVAAAEAEWHRLRHERHRTVAAILRNEETEIDDRLRRVIRRLRRHDVRRAWAKATTST